MHNYNFTPLDKDESIYMGPPVQVGGVDATVTVQDFPISSSGHRGIFCWDITGMVDMRSFFDKFKEEELDLMLSSLLLATL